MTESRVHRIVAGAVHAGMRLDAFISASVEGLSRSRAKALIDEGFASVGGRCAKASRQVSAGDRVVVKIPPPRVAAAVPEGIPLEILYEDRDIVVVAKPAGMVVHPAAGHPGGTLVNALMAHCKDLSGIGGELRAGIVHRLDKGTSGCIVAAKNDAAHSSLAAQFKARTVSKSYLALVFGSMKAEGGEFDKPIGRSKFDRKRMSSRTGKGRSSLTRWRVAERVGKDFSWLEIELKTGRMHQIRVHFSEAGHPLVGDSTYGGIKRAKRLSPGKVKDLVEGFARPALHSWKLAIDHPRTGERMEFVSPLPEDISSLLLDLGEAVKEEGGEG
ncbi:MAG TPA: RluA family pseudouridine synthase [bacterium]|nr:RluA family pseudouridine synthase [bacterium]